MKTPTYLIVILLLSTFISFAQPPQAIPYQAVARDQYGDVIINQSVSLRFSIHDATITGTMVYSETQTATTNNLGLFTLNIGQGTVVTGNFSLINWGNGSKFIQTEMDITGGTNFIDIGTQQMLSVPYALYSKESGGCEWKYLSKKTFSNSSIQQDFTSLSTHDQWKLVWSVENNSSDPSERLILNIGLNGVAGNGYSFMYYRFSGGQAIGLNKSEVYESVNIAGLDNFSGETIITGKVKTSDFLKSFYTSGSSGIFGGTIIQQGYLKGDNADVFEINIIPNNTISGTVELWFKDFH